MLVSCARKVEGQRGARWEPAMITYRKGFPSPYSLLFRIHGAAWIRTLLPAFTAFFMTVVIGYFGGRTEELEQGWRHPYTYQTFAYIVGFAIVFRNGSAYQRYNQARNDLQVLSGKLVEAVAQLCTFDLLCSTDLAKGKSKEFRRALIHQASLLHGLMFQYLRSDWNLDNLRSHVPGKHPVQDSHRLPMLKSMWFTSSYWSTILCLQTTQRAQEVYNDLTPLLVVGGVEDEEREALYPQMDGGDLYVGHLAPACVRVETAYSWLHRLILARTVSGGLACAPPVLSRSYQVLNDAMNAFNQVRGIGESKDTDRLPGSLHSILTPLSLFLSVSFSLSICSGHTLSLSVFQRHCSCFGHLHLHRACADVVVGGEHVVWRVSSFHCHLHLLDIERDRSRSGGPLPLRAE